MNPFKLVQQNHKLILEYRHDNPSWAATDLYAITRTVAEVTKQGWRINKLTIQEGGKVEVGLWRLVTAWRAFMQPYPVNI